MGLFYNSNGEESQNKKKTKTEKLNKSIKEKLNIEQSRSYPGKLGTRLKYLGANSNSDSYIPQGSMLNFIFR